MATVRILKEPGPPRHTRGQGVVETLVVLPVLLVLICLLVQLFLLAVARIQLQYAAFYAARTGIVHGGDIPTMEKTVRRILSASWGLSTFRPGSLTVETACDEKPESPSGTRGGEPDEQDFLTARVAWSFPLTVPMADVLIGSFFPAGPFRPGPTVPLRAVWTLAMQRGAQEEDGDGR